MVTNDSAIQTVKSFAKEIKASGLGINRIILFGSFAAGVQREDSDMDVALVSPQFIGVGFKDIPLFVHILRKYFFIQPKTFSTSEFNPENPFVEEIIRTGIEIPID